MIQIRPEQREDIPGIRRVLLDAFPSSAEADLVDNLRERAAGCVSLVAEQASEIVGHILFSPVTLKETPVDLKMAGLAPMAVLASQQNKGIGSQLVEAGLQACRQHGYELVVVLGHPEYYPRFGFKPSVDLGLKSEYDVPAEVFMAQHLNEQETPHLAGTIVYHACFQELE